MWLRPMIVFNFNYSDTCLFVIDFSIVLLSAAKHGYCYVLFVCFAFMRQIQIHSLTLQLNQVHKQTSGLQFQAHGPWQHILETMRRRPFTWTSPSKQSYLIESDNPVKYHSLLFQEIWHMIFDPATAMLLTTVQEMLTHVHLRCNSSTCVAIQPRECLV